MYTMPKFGKIEKPSQLITLSAAGLQDAIFSKQISQIGSILEVFAMECVGIFYGN
jgi:hypothetical protein